MQSGGLSWQVPTGRRDGRVSIQSESMTLPGANDSVAVQKKKFGDLGLNIQELVTLAGKYIYECVCVEDQIITF